MRFNFQNINQNIKKKFRYIDLSILIPVFLLCGIGIVMVYSAAADFVVIEYGASPLGYLIKQAAFMIIGIGIMIFLYILPIKIFKYKGVSIIALGITFILLMILFVLARVMPSLAINGAVAWIPIGPIHIQPTEIAKLTIIIYLAYIFSRREDRLGHRSYRELYLGPLLLCVLMMGIVFLQPDFGGTAILAATAFVMTLTSGIPYRYSAIFGVSLAALIGSSVAFVKNLHLKSLESNYMYRRLMAFSHPFKYESTDGKQLINSYYAINNGGWFGVGLGNSVQKKGYLPEPYTDFILSVISEELGFIGVLVVVGLIFALISRIYIIAIRAKDAFNALVCFGIGTMLLMQTVFNIGGVCGLLPITGVTLPFISYGGSSVIVLFTAIGLVLNVSAAEKEHAEVIANEKN